VPLIAISCWDTNDLAEQFPQTILLNPAAVTMIEVAARISSDKTPVRWVLKSAGFHNLAIVDKRGLREVLDAMEAGAYARQQIGLDPSTAAT
jgi:hypothetical protein